MTAPGSRTAVGRVELRQRDLVLHWVCSRGWYASRGYEIRWSRAGIRRERKGTLRSDWASWLCRYPFPAQVARLGVHNLIWLSSGTLIGVADGTVFRSTDGGATFSPVFSEFRGRRPLRSGICHDHIGRIYLAEYWLNEECSAVRLWRSDNDGRSWSPVHTWPTGEIQHVHFVQYDPYEQAIWVGTGDRDRECQIAYSRDGGSSFQAVGSGSQIWRAVSVLFTPEAVLWGTDTRPRDDRANYIVRWDRSTGTLHRVLRVGGPVYYSTRTQDALVVGTAVEAPRRGEDKHVQLYWSKDHRVWQSLRLWRKWPLPGVCGPATITFPSSPEPQPRLLLNVNPVFSRCNGSLLEALL